VTDRILKVPILFRRYSSSIHTSLYENPIFYFVPKKKTQSQDLALKGRRFRSKNDRRGSALPVPTAVGESRIGYNNKGADHKIGPLKEGVFRNKNGRGGIQMPPLLKNFRPATPTTHGSGRFPDRFQKKTFTK